MPETAYHSRPDDKRNQQGRQNPEDGAQGQLLEDIEAAVVLAEVFRKVDQHD
jgi:hypothetical protein